MSQVTRPDSVEVTWGFEWDFPADYPLKLENFKKI